MESECINRQVHTIPLESRQKQQRIQFVDNRTSAIALTKLVNAIQRTPLPNISSASDIIQRASHVKFYEETHEPIEDTLEGTQTKPVIVLESFGPNVEQLMNIQAMAINYEGPTMAILGINKKITTDPPLPETIPEDLNTAVTRLKEVTSSHRHQVVVAPFTWNQPHSAQADYDFPYLEARGKLMQIAEGKAAAIDTPIAFRWIDRDVQDDPVLNNTVPMYNTKGRWDREAEKRIVTGAYNWRQEVAPPPASRRETLLNDINAAETSIRTEWYRLQSIYTHELSTPKSYLPEPNLYLNAAAHTAWTGRTPTSPGEGAQSRESEFFHKKAEETVTFLPTITVSKPIKNQGRAGDYLPILNKYTKPDGGLKMKRTSIISPTALKQFLQDLNDIRQSAFSNGNWYFSQVSEAKDWKTHTDQEWVAAEAAETTGANRNDVKAQYLLNAERRRQADIIYAHLTNN